MAKTWFITGAARGLGAAIAKAALAAGDNVVATARDEKSVREAIGDQGERTLFLPLDVTDSEAPARAVQAVVARFGRIDVLANVAGYGHIGAFEESTEDDIRRQFEINVFGLMRMTREVLPVMRRQRQGHIINFSSIGGIVPFELCTVYGTSKFAVEGFSANLAMDVKPFGIHVTVVAPGFFRTDFLDPRSASFSEGRIADYEATRAASEAAYRTHSRQQLGDPEKLGTAIVTLTTSEAPPVHLLLGTDALQYVRKELQERGSEIDRWAVLSSTTDHV